MPGILCYLKARQASGDATATRLELDARFIMKRNAIKFVILPVLLFGICGFSVGCTREIDYAVRSLESNIRYTYYNFPYSIRGLYNVFF